MSPDEICRKTVDSPPKLVVRMLDADTILIEGQPRALEFLAELFKAVASDSSDDGFSISPRGAGGAFFDKAATIGIYIHRLD